MLKIKCLGCTRYKFGLLTICLTVCNVLNLKTKSLHSLKGGIPQGSTLGPLMFLVYVNEMPSIVEHSILLQFVDDMTVACSSENYNVVNKKSNSDLQIWIAKNRIRLIVQKSSVMWFSPKSIS